MMNLLNSPFLCTLMIGFGAVLVLGLLVVFLGQNVSIRDFGAYCLLVVAAAFLGALL